MTVQTTFRQVDKLWYGAPDQLTVPFAISQGGGLVAPLKEPLVARGYTTRANTFTVVGTSRTVRRDDPRRVPQPRDRDRRRRQSTPRRPRSPTTRHSPIDTRPGRMSVMRNGTKIASLTATRTPHRRGPAPGAGLLTLTGSSSTGNRPRRSCGARRLSHPVERHAHGPRRRSLVHRRPGRARRRRRPAARLPRLRAAAKASPTSGDLKVVRSTRQARARRCSPAARRSSTGSARSRRTQCGTRRRTRTR